MIAVTLFAWSMSKEVERENGFLQKLLAEFVSRLANNLRQYFLEKRQWHKSLQLNRNFGRHSREILKH